MSAQKHDDLGPACHHLLETVYCPLDTLKPDPANPRRHSRKQVKQIAESIRSFGFNVPVLVDSDHTIIAGHGRVLAARELGWSEVPTIRLEHLSEAQKRAFMIADNQLTLNAEWDDELLGAQLKALSELNLDFSIEATGFEMPEIDFRIERLSQPVPKEDSADDLAAVATGVAVTQPGDLWQLGPHRVLCGSATDAAAYSVLMADTLAAAIFADPPYNVRIGGNVGGLGAVRHREFAMASGEMSEAEFRTFLTDACGLMSRHSTDGSLHYICMDWRHIGGLQAAGSAAYGALKNVCVWAKTNAGMGSLYRSQHELVFVFRNGIAPHRNNVELGKHGRNRTNVWHYPSPAAFGRIGEEGNLLALHPTVKPVGLVADAILDCTARGDIVLDPFLGSGTTVIAAERVGRRCYGIELDPLYVDTIIRRWQAYGGDDAILARTGETFTTIVDRLEGGHGR